MSPGNIRTDLRADLEFFNLPVIVEAHFASQENTIFTLNTGDLSLGSVITMGGGSAARAAAEAR